MKNLFRKRRRVFGGDITPLLINVRVSPCNDVAQTLYGYSARVKLSGGDYYYWNVFDGQKSHVDVVDERSKDSVLTIGLRHDASIPAMNDYSLFTEAFEKAEPRTFFGYDVPTRNARLEGKQS
jgi:hypothetical protein